MQDLLDRLAAIVDRYNEVGKMITDPDVISDMKRYPTLMKEYKDLGVLVDKYHEYKKVSDDLKAAREILYSNEDPDLKELAQEEFDELTPLKEKLDEEVKYMLIPKDPEDTKNCIMEIRAGTGGDEASIFAGDLYRMYTRYIQNQGWKFEVLNQNEGTMGGFKEISFEIVGAEVYGTLKFESGVHRVQRVPETEAGGRIHTSAATVAVLPEVEDVEIEINESDIRIDTYRSSGAGGQHVNKTDSAVRITHLPTGVVVTSSEKSQHQNRARAMKVLQARLYDMQRSALDNARADSRKSQVGSGDRSERIRTYNFPQGRVTDHRINLTLYSLPKLLEGDGLDEMIKALIAEDQAERLASLEDEYG